MGVFFRGFVIPFAAIRFLRRNNGLVKYALIPFLINLFIFTLGSILAWMYFTDWLHALLPSHASGWYWAIIYYITAIIFIIFLLIMLVMAFTFIGSIIASPFNEILSEKTEKILTGKWNEDPFSFKLLIGDIGRSIGQEIKKLTFFGMVFIFLLFLNVVPVLGNFMYLPLQLGCTFLILAMEFVDFAMSRRRMSFRQKISYTYHHAMPLLSFGSVVFLIGLIPLLNYFLLPIAVVGGHAAFLRTGIESLILTIVSLYTEAGGDENQT